MLGINSLLGKKCFLCTARFWRKGGVLRFTHSELEEGEYEEKVICESCSRDMERIAAEGRKMKEQDERRTEEGA